MKPIALHGGPMDGWIVPPDAPCMRPDWYLTIPRPAHRSLLDIIRRRPAVIAPPGHPGRYMRAGRVARWTEG